MRILFSTYLLAFQNPGGGERVLLSLRDELRNLGHEVDLYDPWVHRFADYDLIHYFSCLENSLWREAKSSAPGVPLVVTPVLHLRPGFFNHLRFLRFRVSARVDSWLAGFSHDLFQFPDFWLPTTRDEADLLMKFYRVPANRMQVLQNGVDPYFLNADPRLFRDHFKVEGPFVLHVGRFDPVKNHRVLIESIRLARLHGVFIGDVDGVHRPYYEECKALAQRAEASDPGGKTRFTFLPAIPHESPLLSSAFSAASVFALPSRFETFGIVALEAAIAGAPLVLSTGLKSREVFESFAAWVDPEDVERLAKELTTAVENRDRLRARIDRKALADSYGWERIAAKLNSVYEMVMK